MKHSRDPLETGPAWSVFPELEPVERRRPQPGGARVLELRPEARRDRASDVAHVRATTMSFTTMAHHGDLLVEYLKARRKVFIDRLGWNLPQAEGLEFDQYDTPFCRWIVIHEFGEVLGGVRLTPTTARCGLYTYMLRDAQRGILENIPRDVLFFEAPVARRIWEASRLFISEAVPARRRGAIQGVLMNQMGTTAAALGATQVIGIVPAVWSRWLRRLGLDAVPVGARFDIDGTASQAALFQVRQRALVAE